MNIYKLLKRILLTIIIVVLLLVSILTAIVYWKQDDIVQHLLEDMNADFRGSIEIADSHISLFENFPYISIDLENVLVHENKEKTTTPIVEVNDIYIGFDIPTILSGKMEIKTIKLKDGKLNLIQHKDGEFNIVKALTVTHKIESANEEFHLDLKEMKLENIALTKLNEANRLFVEAYISDADSKFKTSPDHVFASLDASFMLNIIFEGDTTFIKHKHFDVNTEIDFSQGKEIMTISPTVIKLEGVEFNMEGSIDFLNDMFLDLKLNGTKPNFDLFIAMAPEELIPTLKKYENKGKIYFDVSVKGKSVNGNTPHIEAKFGCEDAYFNNYMANKKLDDLNFSGYFTNGEKNNFSTMEFGLKNFSAKPEAGIFSGNLIVKNFESPDINLQLKSQFELDFLAKFFNLQSLKNLKGKIALTMNFRDIINLGAPEKTIEKLNESYYTELKIEDLSFSSSTYGVPIKDVDLYAKMNGHEAVIDYCNILIGKSDISLKGSISDLPAIIHHTKNPVTVMLNIKSKFLDIYELTGSDSVKSVNEQIENLSLKLQFKSSAKSFSESPNLPTGEFFIDNLYAELKHYPHTLHDFHADVFIENEDFRVIDFKGMIDKTDFLFSGRLKHYDLWFAEHPVGDTKIEFNFTSKLFQLHDIFSYKGENYVPEDYRHEAFDNLKIHGYTDLVFKNGLRSIDLYFDKFDAKMKVHPMRFENFKGRIHYADDHLVVENFSGKIGKSDFKTTLHYYLGKDKTIKKRDNNFELTATRIDFDELFNYNSGPSSNTKTPVQHDAGFNIYELPFTDMTYNFNIDHLNYHRYLIHNIKAKLRSTPQHYIHCDEVYFDAAGGSFDITGYFNGSNPKLIYFSPKIKIKNIDLDKLLFKFENFGQDYIVSENLHGKLSGIITGKIHVHNDLVPKIDDSEIHMDVKVTNGKLENYALLDCMSEYFGDRNLKIVRFDTLANHFDLTKSVLYIPKMVINSSLGFIEFSGKQDMNMNMEYYIKIPFKVVTQAAASKLFGKKETAVDSLQVDSIQYTDLSKKVRFVNVKITGNPDNYSIKLGKDKFAEKN